MTLYIVPTIVDSGAELVTLAAKAGVSVLQPQKLYSLYPEAISGAIVVAAMDEKIISLLYRYTTQLLPENPTIIVSAPGCVYSPTWMMHAAPFPAIDYIEFAGKIAKTGLLARGPENVEKQARETTLEMSPAAKKFAMSYDDPEAGDELSDES